MTKGPKMSASDLLNQRIAALQLKKLGQERDIREKAESLLQSVRPAGIMKDALHDMAGDHDLQLSATQAALKVGSRFLVFKALRRFGGFYGAVAAAVAGTISDKYVGEATPKLVGTITEWFKALGRKKADQQNQSDPNPHMYI